MMEMTYTPKSLDIQATERALVTMDMKYVSLGLNASKQFTASCYWPDGDIGRGKHCYGAAPTLAEAIAKMREKIEIAKAEAVKLRTAAEMREAVLKIVPADYRERIEALPVAA